jgi:hypothetical protein
VPELLAAIAAGALNDLEAVAEHRRSVYYAHAVAQPLMLQHAAEATLHLAYAAFSCEQWCGLSIRRRYLPLWGGGGRT